MKYKLLPRRTFAKSLPQSLMYRVGLLILTLACGLSQLKPLVTQAQVINEETTVTATVADNAPPTTPILISPSNNSYVNTSLPTFVWEASTDDNGIGHYRLSLDGSTLFDNIPTTATDNSQYTLTFNAGNNRYSLTPKSQISQGTHTWQIGAYDNLNNLTNSATWTFTIDTQAPSFVLTQIGTETVSISAQDPSTVPLLPIELDANEPLLRATGEANSNVQVTLTIPGDPTQNFSQSIDSSGNWSLQLGLLPRDIVMTLDFTITDLAGNVSVLSGVRFTIPTEIIVIPGTPTPTPFPSGSALPSPTASSDPGGGGGTPGSSPTPQIPGPSPFITIPVVPPREIIREVFQETGEFFAPFTNFASAFLPQEVRETLSEIPGALAPVSAVVVAAAIPTISTLALVWQFGMQVSPEIIARILQTLGLIPGGKPQGMVFESDDHTPVPFALLSINSLDPSQAIAETVVTDVNGIYKGLHLPPGEYRLNVSHQDYKFPTVKKRPNYLQMADFYKGEVFRISSSDQQAFFLIPVDRLENTSQRHFRTRVTIWISRLTRRTNSWMYPLFGLSGLLAIAFPSIWNLGVFGIYTAIVSRKLLLLFKHHNLVGTVVDQNGQPLDNVIVRVKTESGTELVALLRSNRKGQFKASIPLGKYQVEALRDGYIWFEGESPLSLYELEITHQPHIMVITMQQQTNF
jgi:hypothetical protein